MLFLWFLVLSILCVVNCEYVSDSYIFEMPDSDVLKSANKYPFKVYWNVPTKQCRYQKNSIPFDDVLRKYGISYNKNDKFEGETITIIYDGGYMPAILSRDGAKYSIRNGGLPQAGDLELHLTAFRETVMRLIPDPDFKGVGVIDMENWRPIFRQHWSQLTSIIDLSLSIEKRQFWWWPTSWLKMEATKRFEDAARIFMEKTLSTAKQMRPKALWGYYGFPYCFNMAKDMQEHCSKAVKEENDRTYWLWADSTALYPSLYSPSTFSTSELEALVRGRLVEANRVKRAEALVLPYFWLKYRDEKFFREKDLIAVFETLQKKNASGVIIWGSSNDVNQFEKCKELFNYIISSFGPIARKYIKRINMLHDEKIKPDSNNKIVPNGALNNTITVDTTTHIAILNNNRENTNNNLINTKKSANISYNIIEQDQLSQYLYETDNNYTDINRSNETSIWDIISYSTESIKQSKPYFVPFITNQTISKKTSSLNNNMSIIAKIFSDNDSSHVFNNKSDNVLKIIENSTSTSNITNNNTGKVNVNDLGKLAENLTNTLKTSDIYNLTEITTEMDSKSIKIMIPEKQLNKYFYEMDDNKTVISSNESDILTIIQYQPNVEEDEDSENLQSPKQNHTESYYVHPSMTNIINYDDIAYLKNTNNTVENSLNNATINSSVTINNSEIVIEANTVPPWLRTNNNSKVLHDFDEKRKMTNDSYENIEGTLIENTNNLDVNYRDSLHSRENDISDYLITAEAKNINTENTPEFPTSPNIETPDMREIDISDNLITIAVKPRVKSTLNIENDKLDGSISSTENPTSPVTMLISGNDSDITENFKTGNSLESTLSLPNNFSRDISEKVEQDEQLLINTTNPSNDSVISMENDILDGSILSTENPTSPVTVLISGNDSDITENFKTGNSLESTLSLPNNFSRDLSEKVEQDEQLLINTTNPSIDSVISIENDILDGSISSTENPTSPVTMLISGKDTDITDNFKTGNSLESTLSLPNNFSRDTSEKVEQDEQFLINTTNPSNDSVISMENDILEGSISSTENPTSPVTMLISGNDTDITDNFKTGNSLESTLSLPNNFSRDISEKVEQDEQLLINITNPSNDSVISMESDKLDGSISSTENPTSPVTMLISGNDSDITDNFKTGNSLESTLSLLNNFSRDLSEKVEQDEQFLINTTNPSNDSVISMENDILDGSISSTENPTSPVTMLISGNDTDITDNFKTGNSLESTLSLPNNFSRDISEKVEQDEQLLINITNPSNDSVISMENDKLDGSISSTENPTSPVTMLISGNDTDITDNFKTGNSLESTLSLPNNFSRDISEKVEQDEQLLINITNPSNDSVISMESDKLDGSISSTENPTSPVTMLISGNDTDITDNFKTGNSLESTLSLPNNFSRDISEKVEQDEQLLINITNPSNDSVISMESDKLDGSISSTENPTSPVTMLISGNDSDITDNFKTGNSLESTLSLPNNFSRDLSEKVEQDEQFLINTTNPSNDSVISMENDILDGSISSTENPTSPVTMLISGNDTDITDNFKTGNSLESTLSLPNNFSRDISEKVEQDEQLLINITNPSNDSVISMESDKLDGSISSTENPTSPVTMLISGNDSDITENFKTGNSLESTLSLPNNFSRDLSEKVEQDEQLLINITNPSNDSVISMENDKLDGSISSTENPTSPVSMLISGNDSDITENFKTGNSLESTLSLPNNFSRDISEKVEQDEQLLINTTNPSNDSVISMENDILDGSILSTENPTSPVTVLISGNDSDITENFKTGNSLESTLSLPNNFSRDLSEKVEQDEQLLINTTNSSIDSVISIENDILDGSISSTENPTSPVTMLISGKDTDITDNFKTGNSLECTLSLPNNFSRDTSEKVEQDEQFLINTTNPSNDSVISMENDILDGSIASTENPTSPVTMLISGNDTDITDNFKTGNSLESTLSLPNNFSRDISEKVEQDEQLLINITNPSNDSVISMESDKLDGSISSTENPTSTVTMLISGNDTDITDNFKTGNSLESTLSLPNNFSRDTSEKVEQDEQLLINITNPSNDSVISMESDKLDGSISSTENPTSPVTMLISGNDSDIKENFKTGNSLKSTLSLPNNFSRDLSEKVEQDEQLLINTTNPSNDSVISMENDILDGSISSTENPTSPVTVLISGNDSDITENFKTGNSLESTLSLPNNFSRDISEKVEQDEQLLINTTNPSNDSVIIMENDILDGSISSTENPTSTVTMLISGNDTDITDNFKTGNSLESTLSLPNNFSRDISEKVEQDEQLLINTTSPSIDSVISMENDILDGSVSSTENPTSPVTMLISGNDSDIIENFKTGNSLESTLSLLPNNFSRVISENVKQDEQLVNDTTYRSVQSTMRIENNLSESYVSSTENSTSLVI